MRPIRHPLVSGPGHRTPATLLAIDERDRYLREAAAFCAGMTDAAAAAYLRERLCRYRSAGWRRDYAENLCPPRLAGRIDAVLWKVLKVKDSIPSERLIRLVLARATDIGADR